MLLFARGLTQRHIEPMVRGTEGSVLFSKYVRYLCVLFLFASFLFFGCKQEPGDPEYELDERLIGTWTSTYSDSYTITATYFSYDDGFGSGYAGTIRHATAFSNTAGVIIIEYDADKKPMYYDENFNPNIPPKGNFVGIYYDNLSPDISVQIAQAINLADYTGAETTTLDAAKVVFTLDKEGDYIIHYGTYTK